MMQEYRVIKMTEKIKHWCAHLHSDPNITAVISTECVCMYITHIVQDNRRVNA